MFVTAHVVQHGLVVCCGCNAPCGRSGLPLGDFDRPRDLDVVPQPPGQGRRSGTQLVDELAPGKRGIGRGQVNGNSCGGGDNSADSADSAAAALPATNQVAEEARGESIWWSDQGCCSFWRVQVLVGPKVQELKEMAAAVEQHSPCGWTGLKQHVQHRHAVRIPASSCAPKKPPNSKSNNPPHRGSRDGSGSTTTDERRK